MRPNKTIIATLLLAASLQIGRPAPSSASESWPGWGGPHQTLSVAPSLGLAAAPTVDLELVWQRTFGSGYTSVVVADGIGVCAATQGDSDYLEAFEPATGKTRWRLRLAPAFLGRSGSDDGPGSTPVVAGGSVFMVHPSGIVVAANLHDGAVRWRRDLVATLGATLPLYGFTMSPLVTNGVVVVPVGHAGEATLAGLDIATGAVLWTAGTDTVGYQNLALATIAGMQQIVFAGNEHLWGIDPSDGKVVWRHALGFRDSSGLVVLAEDSHVLFTSAGDQTFLLAIARREGRFETRRVWEQPVFKNNHCVPIFHEDHFYGFDGRFLTAVRADDGSVVWKSRPPGGQNLALVDGHLFTLDGQGALRVVEATPEGYREKGALALADPRRVFTPPSYAVGLLLLRDLSQLYAVRVRPGTQPAQKQATTETARTATADNDPVDRFLAVLARTPSDQRAAVIDRFLAEHTQMPIVTASDRAHFFYRGDLPDLALQGDMTGRWPEEVMHRIAGTNLFHRAFNLPPQERWEYRFKIFEEPTLDPANPAQVEGPEGTFSVVTGRGWRPPARSAAGAARHGRLESVSVTDPANDRTYSFSVYTPPDFDPAATVRPLPLVFFSRGTEAISHGQVVDLLDAGVGSAFAPLIAVFLELPAAAWFDQNRSRFFEIMDSLVMPRIEQGWPVDLRRSQRAWITRATETSSVLLFALRHPEHLAKLALRSPLYGPTFLDRDVAPLLDAHPGLILHVDWGRFDGIQPNWPADVPRDAPALAQRISDRGWPVTTHQRAGGHNWTSWQTDLPAILERFFPLVEAKDRAAGD